MLWSVHIHGKLLKAVLDCIRTRPLLTNGGGGGQGVPLGLPQDQAAHPPTDPLLPPLRGGGLCCYNQLVTQEPCVFAQKNSSPSVTMRSLNSTVAELAVTLVVDHCTGKLSKHWLNPHCLRTGNFCHFLPHGPEIFATF